DVLDRLDLFGEHGRQRLDADRAGGELLDDRGEELAIGRVEPLFVDLHPAHRLFGDLPIDPAGAVDLGEVADPLEQPVDDPGRPAPAAGDRVGRLAVDVDPEDPGRAADDRGEVGIVVEVEAGGGAPPGPGGAAGSERPGR